MPFLTDGESKNYGGGILSEAKYLIQCSIRFGGG
jgi:hypothetical protein